MSRNAPVPIPISTCSRHEEANLVLFANILSIILSQPGKMPDPVPEHALESSKVRPFHTCAIASSMLSLEENSRSLRICFHIPKGQKSHGFISGEEGGCGILEMWFFLTFDVAFDSLWHME
jgi:hypothetical protein